MSITVKDIISNHDDIILTTVHINLGDGWLPLLNNTLQDMKDKCPDVKISTIKEKFGALRIYFKGPMSILGPVVAAAEEASLVTCEICGDCEKADLIMDKGWLRVRCDAHKDDTRF